MFHDLACYGCKRHMSDRMQSVILEGTVSMQVQVLSGVPQGTVLGPLLFLAYTNDMPETATSSEIKLFADDSLLYRTINNRRWCGTLSNAFVKSKRMISTCESLSNFDAISWMVTMSWDSHDRFLQNPCWALVHCIAVDLILKHNQKGTMLGRVRYSIYSTNMIHPRDVTWRGVILNLDRFYRTVLDMKIWINLSLSISRIYFIYIPK
jgi:hypothetical protein